MSVEAARAEDSLEILRNAYLTLRATRLLVQDVWELAKALPRGDVVTRHQVKMSLRRWVQDRRRFGKWKDRYPPHLRHQEDRKALVAYDALRKVQKIAREDIMVDREGGQMKAVFQPGSAFDRQFEALADWVRACFARAAAKKRARRQRLSA